MLREKLKALIAKMLSERFSFSSSMKEFRRTRRLRFETLETRRLLSANTFLEVPDESNAKITEVFGENRTICSAISFSDAVLEEMESESLFEEAANCSMVSVVTYEKTFDDASNDVDEEVDFSSVQEVAFSEISAELDEDSMELNNETAENVISVSSGGGAEIVTVEIPSIVCTSSGTLNGATSGDGVVSFIERSGVEGSGGGIPEESSFFAVTLPTLPNPIEGRVTFAGSATIGRDYNVFYAYEDAFQAWNYGGTTYSGGGPTFYFVPKNDNYREVIEDVVISFEAFYSYPSGGGDSGGSGGSSEPSVVYQFEYGTNSASFKIIDDDQWHLALTKPVEENGHILEPCSGSLTLSDLSGSFKIERTLNATGKSLKEQYPNYSLDDSYQITVDLSLGGEAELLLDYELRSEIDGNHVASTFSIGSGVVGREIWIRALDDSVFETDENVRIAINDAYIGAHNYGVDIAEGDVAFMIHQAPEFVKSLDEPTPVMVNDDVFHSWEISKRTSRTLVAQVHSVANSDNLKYSILSGNERNWYSIDENTGDIYTTSQYDDDLANNAELMCSPTTLSVRVEDNSSPYGGEEFCDIATVKLGELYYARVYDSHRASNRSTRTVQRLENDARTALEDNKRSDYENFSNGGIVLAGYDSSMSAAVIRLEVGVSEEVREHVLWRATANNGCTLLTATSGSFSYNNTPSFVVEPSKVPDRRDNKIDDLVIEIGFDSDSDGLLEDDEVLIGFQNAVIGSEEYEMNRVLLLDAYRGSHLVSLPISRELLGIFMERISEGTYSTCTPYTLEYGANDVGYSQSNGLGIDSPGLTSGSIDSYYWDTNSLFSQKICESQQFITAVIDSVYEEALSEATQYYDSHPNNGTASYSAVLSDVTVNLSYSGFNDLSLALGHCRAMLSGVIVYTRYVDNQIYFDGLSVMGRCSDLYDFRTLWDVDGRLDFVGRLVAAASVVQIGHRRGAREEGGIFRVEAHLSDIYTPSSPVLLGDKEDIIASLTTSQEDK